MIHSYPKVWPLRHPNVAEIMNRNVLVEEKVDGSQFSFGVKDGKLACRSKGQEVNLESADKLFAPAVNTAKELFGAGKLHEGYTYRCETLAKPKHNTIAYGRVPTGNIVLFDVDTGFNAMLDRDDKEAVAAELGIEVVPVLHRGPIASLDVLRDLMNRVSFLGTAVIEGVVIKDYARFLPESGHFMCAKIVSEDFKATHAKTWREGNPTPSDIRDFIADKCRSDLQWNKAVQHLAEQGLLRNAPEDIGRLIEECKKDTLEEQKAIILDELWKWAAPHVARKCVSGLPEWYKTLLAKKAFGGGQ